MKDTSVKKILILAANPKNTEPLRLNEEFREIKAVLERSRFRERFELIYAPAVRPKDLQQELLNHEPEIVHFSGHGAGAEGLVVENDAGLAQLIKSRTLGWTFKQHQVECVLLNACYSEEQAEAIYQYVPCVVGMNQAIGDRAAIAFSVGFYGALGASRSYEEAFEFGCNAIDQENIPEYLIPKLKSRRREEGSATIAETASSTPDDARKLVAETTPSPPKISPPPLQPTPMTSSNSDLSPSPLNIFISYSHRDERLRETLGRHLSSLQRQGVIKSWHDRKISAGSEWAHTIDQNLNSAEIILLLISENFTDSDYCYDIEMQRAIARHEAGEARVIPIILKPVDWKGAPFGKLQALPKDAKPVTTWSNRGEAFLNIAEGIKEAARAMAAVKQEKQSAVLEEPQATPSPVELPKMDRQRDLNRCEPDICLVESNGYFYIVRSRLEKHCYEELLKPGMLIRIKSPDKMGKSLMMSRVLDSVSQKGYRTAIIDLRQANQQFFLDINQFLQWFCAYVADQLNVEQSPEENWKSLRGANLNCTKYFEKYLLSSVEEPLVIAIDNFDCIFDRPNIETDFSGLLRGWFEKVNTNKVWGKLRQIIVYSQETHAIKDINQSPFNVGVKIELDELDSVQVLALANAYGLSWTEVETEKLMDTIGGHPYLIQLALDQIAHQDIALDELLKIAPTEEGIYGAYLNERLQHLEENPSLVEAMRQVVNSDIPVRLRSKETFKLDSMGLIKRQGNDIVPRCNLYRLYFRDRLRE